VPSAVLAEYGTTCFYWPSETPRLQRRSATLAGATTSGPQREPARRDPGGPKCVPEQFHDGTASTGRAVHDDHPNVIPSHSGSSDSHQLWSDRRHRPTLSVEARAREPVDIILCDEEPLEARRIHDGGEASQPSVRVGGPRVASKESKREVVLGLP
jgi:hypothetical protein